MPIHARFVRAAVALCGALVVASSLAATPKVGELAPDFVGIDHYDHDTLLSTYRGKVVVVSFWASWCGPCLKELPILERIQETAGKDQIQVIAVNTESREVYRRAAKVLGSFELMLNFDVGKKSSTSYGVSGIPHMIIIDRAGRIVRINQGYGEDRLDRIIADINGALKARD